MKRPERKLERYFLFDGCKISDLESRHKGLSKALIEKGIISGTDISVSFVGFLQREKSIYFFLPKPGNFTSIKPDQTLALTVMRTLTKYYADQSKKGVQRETAGHFIESQNLSFAIGLLTDWQKNGTLKIETDQIKIQKNGRIDWPRTLKTIQPIYKNNSVIYDRTQKKKRTNSSNLLINQIHKWIIGELDTEYGWLISKKMIIETENALDRRPSSNAKMLSCLKEWKSKTSSVRTNKVIDLMISYLINKTYGQQKAVYFGTHYFQNIWQEACSVVLGCNKNLLRENIPQPIYSGFGNTKFHQEPDIILQRAKNLIVVDAKYYDTEVSLPGWHDLVKQFFYSISLQNYAKGLIGNYMVFPSSTNTFEIKKPPFVKLQIADRSLDEYGVVYCIFLPLLNVLSSYLTNSANEEFFRQIFDHLESAHAQTKGKRSNKRVLSTV